MVSSGAFRVLLPLILAIALVLLFAREPGPPREAAREGAASGGGAVDGIALLVGIDSCAGAGRDFSALRGCRHDVERMQRVLRDRFGFKDVVTLLDEQATHERIVRAFSEQLIRKAGPQTQAVFYFAGHGSRTPDRSGFDFDGMDGTYLAYDSRAGARSGEYDITDDELGSLVRALAERTPFACVIADCCHSGDGLRGAGSWQVRAVPPGETSLDPADPALLRDFWPEEAVLLDDGEGGELPTDRFVHIAACGFREEAREHPIRGEDGVLRHYGALTWFLSRALERATPRSTYESVLDAAAFEMITHGFVQRPEVSGTARRALFDGRFEDRGAELRAFVETRRTLMVRGGWLDGIRRGHRLSVTDPEGRGALGEARVGDFGWDRCVARWIGDPPDLERGSALLVTSETRAGGEPPLRVAVEDPGLRGLLGGLEEIELLEGEPCVDEYRLGREEELLVLRTAEGIPIWSASVGGGALSPEEVDRLRRDAFREELKHRAWISLGSARGALRLRAALRPARPEELEGARARTPRSCEGAAFLAEGGIGEVAEAVGRVREAGSDRSSMQIAALDVTNESDRAVWIGVLSISEDRHRAVFCRGNQPADELEPGQSRTFEIGIVCPRQDLWSLERPMLDRYLVIAARSRMDLLAYDNSERYRSAPEASTIPEIVRLAIEGSLLRGEGDPEIRADGWGLACADILVHFP